MAHFTQIVAKVSVIAPSGDLTAPDTPTIANVVGQSATFDLRIARELLEATELGDDFRQWARGVGEWDGTLTLHVDPDDTAQNQDELWESLLPNDFAGSLVSAGEIQVNWWIDTTSGSAQAYYGAMFVEEASTSVGSGLSTTVLRCRGNGAVVYAGSLL